MKNQIGVTIIGRFVPVDEHQTISPVVVNQPRRRVYRQAGARHDEHIRVPDSPEAALHGFLIQPLLVEHHVGLHDPAAVATGNPLGILNKLRTVEFAAAHTVVAQDAAVKLIDPTASRLLVQAVDILGHHGAELSFSLPPGQHLVGYVGFKAQRQHLLPVKTVKILRVSEEKAVADDGFRGIVKLLAVQSVHAAKVRNTRFRTHACPAKKDDIATLGHPLFQNINAVHMLTILSYSKFILHS